MRLAPLAAVALPLGFVAAQPRPVPRPETIGLSAPALAHEAFHILHTGASEAEALAFGQACARSLLRPVPSGD